MNVDPSGTSLGLLALVNPMEGWLVAATGLMALGGLIALLPRRQQHGVAVRAEAPAGGHGAAAQGSR